MNQIENFPPEVIEWMCDQQEKQGNKRDKSVFEKFENEWPHLGGFDWEKTKEGFEFCRQAVSDENFDLFFERYPKTIITTIYENNSITITPPEGYRIKPSSLRYEFEKICIINGVELIQGEWYRDNDEGFENIFQFDKMAGTESMLYKRRKFISYGGLGRANVASVKRTRNLRPAAPEEIEWAKCDEEIPFSEWGKKKYRPFTETSISWCGMKIRRKKDKVEFSIFAVSKDFVFYKNYQTTCQRSLLELFDYYEVCNGKEWQPFGEVCNEQENKQ